MFLYHLGASVLTRTFLFLQFSLDDQEVPLEHIHVNIPSPLIPRLSVSPITKNLPVNLDRPPRKRVLFPLAPGNDDTKTAAQKRDAEFFANFLEMFHETYGEEDAGVEHTISFVERLMSFGATQLAAAQKQVHAELEKEEAAIVQKTNEQAVNQTLYQIYEEFKDRMTYVSLSETSYQKSEMSEHDMQSVGQYIKYQKNETQNVLQSAQAKVQYLQNQGYRIQTLLAALASPLPSSPSAEKRARV